MHMAGDAHGRGGDAQGWGGDARASCASPLGTPLAKGIKRSRILRSFQKCVELLRQEVPKDFFSEKRFFAKIFQVPKNSVFCNIFFPLGKLETSAHF
jgi:hypothetical protein